MLLPLRAPGAAECYAKTDVDRDGHRISMNTRMHASILHDCLWQN